MSNVKAAKVQDCYNMGNVPFELHIKEKSAVEIYGDFVPNVETLFAETSFDTLHSQINQKISNFI